MRWVNSNTKKTI